MCFSFFELHANFYAGFTNSLSYQQCTRISTFSPPLVFHTIPFLNSCCYFLAHCCFRKSLSMPYPIIVFSIPLPSDNQFSDLMLKSVVHFELMFVQGETLGSPFLCVWVSNFPGAICWKGWLPPVSDTCICVFSFCGQIPDRSNLGIGEFNLQLKKGDNPSKQGKHIHSGVRQLVTLCP